MSHPTPSSVKLSLEEKTAWMRAPVRLNCPHIPRFALMLLEYALHRYLCSVAAWFEEFMRQYRAGTLPGWPDAAGDDAADEPRVSRYRKKSPPTAPRRRAGAAHAQSLPEAAPELEAKADWVGGDARRSAMTPPKN